MTKLIDYFRSPFPGLFGSRIGTFSAYKMPGLAVQLPVLLAFGVLGLVATQLRLGLLPIGLFWVIAGTYLGRDLAILCHYFLILAPVAWIAISWGIPSIIDQLPEPLPFSLMMGLTAAIGSIWGLVIYLQTKD